MITPNDGRYHGYDHAHTEAVVFGAIGVSVEERYFQLTGDRWHSIQMGAIAAKRWMVWYCFVACWWFFFLFGNIGYSSGTTGRTISRLAVSPLLAVIYIRNAHFSLSKASIMGAIWGWLARALKIFPTFILYIVIFYVGIRL